MAGHMATVRQPPLLNKPLLLGQHELLSDLGMEAGSAQQGAGWEASGWRRQWPRLALPLAGGSHLPLPSRPLPWLPSPPDPSQTSTVIVSPSTDVTDAAKPRR